MDVVLLNEIYAPVEMIICFFYKTNMVSLIVLFSFVISTLYSWDNWHLVIVYYPYIYMDIHIYIYICVFFFLALFKFLILY